MIPANNDGRIFISKDKLTKLTVSGINNVLDDTISSWYVDESKQHKKISYKKKSSNWFVMSWIDGNIISYEKTIVGKGSVNTFLLEYPKSQNDLYKLLIPYLLSTFSTPEIEDIH